MIRLFSLSLITAIFSINCYGQEWLDLYKQSQDFYNNDQLTEAFEAGEKSRQFYEKEFGKQNQNYCSILRHLLLICYATGELDKGLEYGKEELGILAGIEINDSMLLAGAHNNLAMLYLDGGSMEQAEQALLKVIDIFSSNAVDEIELAIANGNLGIALYGQSKLDQAEPYLFRSVSVLQKQEQLPQEYLSIAYNYALMLREVQKHAEAIGMLSNLIDIYSASGMEDFEEYYGLHFHRGMSRVKTGEIPAAEEDLKFAFDAYSRDFGGTDQRTVEVKEELALIYQQQGKSKEATELLGTSLTGAVAGFTTLGNMAALKQNEGNLNEALSLYDQAIEAFDQNDIDNYENYLTTLGNAGRLNLSLNNKEKAKQLFDLALKFAEGNTNIGINKLRSSLNDLGNYYVQTGEYSLADQQYNLAAEMDDSNNDVVFSNTLGGLAKVAIENGFYSKADSLTLEALQIVESVEGQNNPRYYLLQNQRGLIFQRAGTPIKAKPIYENLIAILEQSETYGNSLAIAYENLGHILMELGDYPESEIKFNQCLEIRKRGGEDSPGYALALSNLATLNKNQGKYNEAEPLFRKSLNILEKSGKTNSPDYSLVSNNLATFYQTMGNFQMAEVLFLSIIDNYQKNYGKNNLEYATAIGNLATLYQITGKLAESQVLLEEALIIDGNLLGKQHPKYATTLHNLASIYQLEGDNQKAKPMLEEALRIDQSVYGEAHPKFAATLNNLGALAQDMGDYDQAENYFQQSLDIRKQVFGENHPDYAYAQFGLASLYQMTGDYQKAGSLYNVVIKEYLDQVQDYFPSLSEKEKSAFFAKINPVFERFKEFAIESAINNGDNSYLKKLYNLQLNTKALLLNASNKVRDRILNSKDNELIASYNKWISLKNKLAKAYSLSVAEIVAENIDITTLEQQANDREKELSLKSEAFAKEFDKVEHNWVSVKNKLKVNEAALELIRIQRNSAVDSVTYIGLIVRNSYAEPALVVFDYGNKLEGRYYKLYKNLILHKHTEHIPYDIFWSPLEDELDDINTIYVSADGIFNKINLNTLWYKPDDNYIVDRYDLRLVSNTKDILVEQVLQTEQNNMAGVFGYPDYNEGLDLSIQNQQSTSAFHALAGSGSFAHGISELPGTKAEVIALQAMLTNYGWNPRTFMEGSAKEDLLKMVSSPRLLHIATHGFFLDDLKQDQNGEGVGIHLNNFEANPLLRSGLLLANASKSIYAGVEDATQEDGILTAYEAMNLNLDGTELIVLSACETGLGEVKNGEGVYGLQRSFIVAGAQNIIMSLWTVNDETTQRLMTLFYSSWLAGENKFDAFKSAQLEIKNEFSDPYYWGAFVILGI